MERKNISIKTYKREPQIWFGTEADSFSYDFVWHLPMQMYGAFGEDLYGNQGVLQVFGYTGYQRDNVAGTYYAQAREYQAEVGRFAGQDLIAGFMDMPLSMNRYSYCFNDPMLLVDLDGAWPEWLDVSEKGAKDKIRDNKENINKAAEEFGVDPKLIAAVIYTEQANNMNFRDVLTDGIGGFYGIDTSIGIGQVKVSTAKLLEDKGYMPKTRAEEGGWSLPIFGFVSGTITMARSKKLKDDATNIKYVAAYIKLIQNTWEKEYPAIVNDSKIVWTLYNTGYLGKNGPHSKPKGGALSDYAMKSYEEMGCLLE